MKPIGWVQEIQGKWCFTEGDLDPREVHNSGKPCHRVYIDEDIPDGGSELDIDPMTHPSYTEPR